MRPRYSWVTPRWRPWPIASITVTPTWLVSASTASITVSTRSRITTASTFVISPDLLVFLSTSSERTCRETQALVARLSLLPRCLLDVEVEGELSRVRPQGDGVDLVLPLVGDPGLDQLRREDASGRQDRKSTR